jgi:excisionase family DNA binding protein
MTDERGKVLLSLEETCEYLQVSKATVYRLIRKGLLERRKIQGDRHCYLTLESLDNHRIAQSFTLEELANRVVSIERKVNFLMGKASVEKSGVSEVQQDLNAAVDMLRKHHPEHYN